MKGLMRLVIANFGIVDMGSDEGGAQGTEKLVRLTAEREFLTCVHFFL
jgi:hypothetical protein